MDSHKIKYAKDFLNKKIFNEKAYYLCNSLISELCLLKATDEINDLIISLEDIYEDLRVKKNEKLT